MSISNTFLPNMQIIEEITNSNPAVVTTTQAHGYDNSLLVRIVLPDPVGSGLPSFGMSQLSNRIFRITVIDDETFSIPINSTDFQPFSPIDPEEVLPHQYPQVIPVAETGYTFSQAVRNNNNIAPET